VLGWWISALIMHVLVEKRATVLSHSIVSVTVYKSTYHRNLNIIRTIFTNNRGLMAGVRIIHVK